MNAAVFLDRDNTIIHNDGDLGDPAQVRLIQGAASAIASLRGLGYKIVVVTNQGGVARGKFTESDVEAVHQKINDLIQTMTGTNIDRFYYCPYHPEGVIERYRREHSWRKPQPGMLIQAAKDMNLDLMQCWMIGDQMRDIEAGYSAGVRTVLLRPDAEELTPLRLEEIFTKQTEIIYKRTGELGPYFTSKNLIEAVRIVAQQRRPETPEEFKAKERIRKFEQNKLPPVRTTEPEPYKPPVESKPVPLVLPMTPMPAEPAAKAPRPVPVEVVPTPEPVVPIATPQPVAAPPAPVPVPPMPEPKSSIFGESPAASRRAPNPPVAEPQPVAPAPVASESLRVEPAAHAVPKAYSTPVAKPAPAPAPAPAAASSPVVQTPLPSKPFEAPAVQEPVVLSSAKPSAESTQASDALAHQLAELNTSSKLLLQEVRNQRVVHGNFSWPMMLAVILQMLAITCMVIGIVLGWSDVGLFLRWLSCGLLIQMATISTLLFKQR